MTNWQDSADGVELLRGGSIVSSFAGAFGSSLRETRITAILGYLIAANPKLFGRAFGITGTIISVRLETLHNRDRSDILIESTDGLAVVEAKVDSTDPIKQAKKYKAKWTILLTQYIPTPSQKKISNVRYLRWQHLAELIQQNTKEFVRGVAQFAARDLIEYLKEHNMIPNNEAVEIYSRDINNDETADFFLKGHVYGCSYALNSRLPQAHYFAPYFGRNISVSHPGLQEGISYIAKILSVEIAETPAEFMAVSREMRKKVGFRGDEDYVKQVKDYFFGKQHKYSFVFMSAPRLAFNPPIKKPFLQKGRGFLNKHFYSFDDFYRAWGGEEIF